MVEKLTKTVQQSIGKQSPPSLVALMPFVEKLQSPVWSPTRGQRYKITQSGVARKKTITENTYVKPDDLNG
jgi:hypothetical protein